MREKIKFFKFFVLFWFASFYRLTRSNKVGEIPFVHLISVKYKCSYHIQPLEVRLVWNPCLSFQSRGQACQLAWPWPYTWEAIIYFWSLRLHGCWEIGEVGWGTVRWEEEMRGEKGRSRPTHTSTPVTQKALSWFNGCEVFATPLVQRAADA